MRAMFSNDDSCYAHPNQLLVDHCENVAHLASDFAKAFGMSQVTEIGGLVHDVGKDTLPFQEYLQGIVTPPNYHTHQGALVAQKIGESYSEIPGYVIDTIVGCIFGHHGGLTSRCDWETKLSETKSIDIPPFDEVFDKTLHEMMEDLPNIDADLEQHPASLFLLFVWVRMVYSCIVDADYIDTEQAMDSERARLRNQHDTVSFADMQKALSDYIDNLSKNSNASQDTLRARELFREVLMERVTIDRGVYLIGGGCGVGKTGTSMGWSLGHAQYHGLSRIIYVIPYNTISDQTFATFYDMFSSLSKTCVVEATSSFEFDTEDDDARTLRLSCENFDAEIVVTSSVNFFESLFSNKPSRCRKLHNIANSVIVIDEAQRMPTKLLPPTLAMLETLVSNFGCSVLMMSGTLPEFNDKAWLSKTDHHVIEDERLDEVKTLLSGRVRYERVGEMTMRQVCLEAKNRLSDDVRSELIVFNKKVQTRVAAEVLRNKLQDSDVSVYCLTTEMSREHRLAVLAEITEKLARGDRVIVCSTSLIEAGIDLDFDFAMRALAGLDSIIQVGGRVNRNGSKAQGVVLVFELIDGDGFEGIEDGAWLMPERTTTEQVVGHDMSQVDEADVSKYLSKIFSGYVDWPGALAVLRSCRVERRFMKSKRLPSNMDFAAIAKEYQLIKDGTECLLVPNTADALACYWKLKNGIRCRFDKYSIAVWPNRLAELVDAGVVEEICPKVFSIIPDFIDTVYDEFGLKQDVGVGDLWSSEDMVL